LQLDRWSVTMLVVAVVLAVVVRQSILRLGAGRGRASKKRGKKSRPR
jgi:hypothetical protein